MKGCSIQPVAAFSLIEVVIALGICTFSIVAMIGLLGAGIQSSKESEEQFQAANLGSLMVTTRRALPTNDIPNFAIPAPALSAPYSSKTTVYVGYDGLTNYTADTAAYQLTYQAGVTARTGTNMAQVYLMLSWPAKAVVTKARNCYECLSFIPLH